MSKPSDDVPPQLADWFDVVDYYWQRQQVGAAARARMRTQAEADFTQSLRDGARLADLVATDPAQFATEMAEADGLPTPRLRPDPPLTTTSLVVTAICGAILGAPIAIASVYPLGIMLMDSLTLTYEQEGFFAIGMHAMAALMCALAATGAVRWRFRYHRGVVRVAILAGIAILVGGAAGVVPAIAVAANNRYSDDLGVVLQEILIVTASCGLTLAAARWIDQRATSRRGTV